jgi:hypothetical protein
MTQITTFTGKLLPIAIPPVEDRIVHRTIRNCLDSVLEENALLDFVSGYRRRRSRLTAVRQAAAYLIAKKQWVVDIDITDCWKGPTVDEIVAGLASWIADGSFLHLVRLILEALPEPLMPGGGLSPTLINVRLIPVDHLLQGFSVVRFVDNYCLFCKSRDEAVAALSAVDDVLARFRLQASRKRAIRFHPNPEDLFLFGG